MHTYDVFIYSSRLYENNSKLIKEFQNFLIRNNLKISNRSNLQYGYANNKATIEEDEIEAIKNSKVFVCFITDDFVKDEWLNSTVKKIMAQSNVIFLFVRVDVNNVIPFMDDLSLNRNKQFYSYYFSKNTYFKHNEFGYCPFSFDVFCSMVIRFVRYNNKYLHVNIILRKLIKLKFVHYRLSTC